MKIIGGKLKGRNFYMPKEVRATQNVVRKALFDILGQDLDGVEFLELFAGSGAIGLEALSREAKRVTFVDNDPKCAQVIEENITLLKLNSYDEDDPRHDIINSDAFASIKVLARQGRKYDIVFCDPPYGRDLAKKALKQLATYDILHPNCIVVTQHERREILPEAEGRFLVFRKKKYGASFLSLYREKLGRIT